MVVGWLWFSLLKENNDYHKKPIRLCNRLMKDSRPMRPMALEGTRAAWKRKSESAGKIAQQPEQAKEQNRDRGMSR
jgi:hypothetical protein